MTAILDTPEQIAAFRLQAIRQAAGFKAKTGMHMTRNMPSVKVLVRQYDDLLAGCRTYAQVEARLIAAGY